MVDKKRLIESDGTAREDVLVEVAKDGETVTFVRYNEGDAVPEHLRGKPAQPAGDRV